MDATVIDGLRWKKLPLLNDGFVCLVDVMGDDAAVVQAARVSYGQDARVTKSEGSNSSPLTAEGQADMDRKLIRYMMRHNHGTPFEMAEVKLLVRVPMDCWRQWIRHRTANVNEYSTRYSEAIDSAQTTPPDGWRLQATANKQGSAGFLQTGEITESAAGITRTGKDFTNSEARLHKYSRQVYEDRIRAGIAREQARKDLPLSTYTEAYWKCDLRNLLHFLGLRMDSHAQQEIREYATVIGEQIIRPLFPLTWEAFNDYRMGAVTLTRLDMEAVRAFVEDARGPERAMRLDEIFGKDKREREECLEKLKRMGLVL